MQKDFSYPLYIDDLNRREHHYHLKADAAQLKTLTAILQVENVKYFVADIYLKLDAPSHRLDIWGKVEAELELKSVITLENFIKKYEAPFAYYFDTEATYKDIKEMDYGINDDIPDIIENGQIDLGNIAIEQLALVMEDYPRRDGEEFHFASEFDEETTRLANPFTVLQKLKK